MKYFINHEISKPAYMQLYEQLRKDIENSVFTYGNKLPSKRLLAEETEVSVITVQHAYSILCDEGYAESRQRSGYFVIYKECDFHICKTSESVSVNRKVIHSSQTYISFSVLSKTMRKVLCDYNESILEKSLNYGCMELRSAISDYLMRSNGISVSPSQIIIGSGAEYLYSLIVQFLGNKRVFGLESPSYEKIRKVYEANSVKCDMLKLGCNGIETSELKRTDATVLHITPFNSFPSGVTANVSKRLEYLEWAKKRNGYIIEDNYDSELTVSRKNEDTVFSLADNESVIYLNTFSKTVAPSMRVGYMVLPKKMLEEFEEKTGFYSCTVPVFEQYVLTELIRSGNFERHINRIRRMRRKNNILNQY